MQYIPTRWLTVMRLTLGLYSAYFMAGYLYAYLLKRPDLQERFGFSLILAVTAGVHLAYEITAGWVVFKRNPWTASVLSIGAALLTTFLAIELTGGDASPYWAVLLALVFLTGALGPYVAPVIVFMLTGSYLLRAAGVLADSTAKPLALIYVASSLLITAVNHFVWKRHYVLESLPQSHHAAGKNKQVQPELLIQSISDGVIVTDTTGKITLINPSAAEMTGWEVKEADGIDVKLVLKLSEEDGKPLNQDIFGEVLAKQQHVSKIAMLTGRQRHPLIISLVLSPVLDPKSNEMLGAIAVLRDISRQRKEEQQRAEFISTASHEMRTPVAAIEGYLALAMNDKVSQIDSKARGYLEKAHASTQHLGKLFQDLLTSAKAEDGRLASHPIVVEMGEYIEQLADSLRFTAEKKGLLMDLVIGSSPDQNAPNGKVVKPLYYVHVDPDRIREVLTNLFDNAVKYTETGKITVGLTGNDNVVQIFVKDTGPGIPAEDIPHLFQKFYRVDSSATRTVGGTGLGLFISRKIVELYNGRVWVESQVNKGSTFYINLPRLNTAQASRLQAEEAGKAASMSTLAA